MGKKIVVALGGNALGNTAYEQAELVKQTSVFIADIIQNGYDVVLAHGNGPQVGMINLSFSHAEESGIIKADMPFPECGAMSQGYIGYHLQNALQNELMKRDIKKNVLTIITQVVVDEKDPAFSNPTKPVGSFYSKEEAEVLKEKKGFTMVEDAGRGYRRVVPSPVPVDVVEKDAVKTLVKDGYVVITVGGGGIPVICKNGSYVGVPAVIDKDYASSKLSELTDADILLILTAVEKVYINYKKENEKGLDCMTVSEAEEYIREGQFAVGSMLPKVKACVNFVKNNKKRKAIISSLDKAALALSGKTGTVITA